MEVGFSIFKIDNFLVTPFWNQEHWNSFFFLSKNIHNQQAKKPEGKKDMLRLKSVC